MGQIGQLARAMQHAVIYGGAAGTMLSQVATALLFFDDFNRADSETVGAPAIPSGAGAWVEEAQPTMMDIVSNKLDMHEGPGTGVKYLHRPDSEGTTGRLFAQAILQWADPSQPAIINFHEAGNAFASRDGYQLRADDSGGNLRIDRHDAGTGTLGIASTAITLSTVTDYYYEFLVEDGSQKGGIWLLSNDTGVTVSATDTVQNGISKRVSIQQGGTSAESLWDAVFAATKETIDVSGLGTGQKIQVQLVSDSSVVVGGTESGGSVSLDCSRSTGIGTPWPALEGIALKLVYLDSSDTVIATLLGSSLPEGNIWPGTFQVN